MESSAMLVSQQSAAPCVPPAAHPPLPGTWAVRAGQALSLRPGWAGAGPCGLILATFAVADPVWWVGCPRFGKMQVIRCK